MLGLLTYALVNVTWVFFRATTFTKAASVLNGMFGLNTGAEPMMAGVHVIAVVVIITGILVTHWLMRRRTLESVVARTPAPLIAIIWVLMAFAILTEQGTGNAFIYFQF